MKNTHELGRWFSPLTHPTPLFDKKHLESPLNILSCGGSGSLGSFPHWRGRLAEYVKSADSGAGCPGFKPLLSYFLGAPGQVTFPLWAPVFSSVKNEDDDNCLDLPELVREWSETPQARTLAKVPGTL